jgi:hypothetical protein
MSEDPSGVNAMPLMSAYTSICCALLAETTFNSLGMTRGNSWPSWQQFESFEQDNGAFVWSELHSNLYLQRPVSRDNIVLLAWCAEILEPAGSNLK